LIFIFKLHPTFVCDPVKPTRILGLIDYNKHQNRPFPFDIYQIFMECEIIAGMAKTGIETIDVGFFDIDSLP